MRPGLVLWHRWFGLLGGLWLLLIAATGSLLVFYAEIDRALAPEFHVAASGQPAPQSLPLDRLADTARQAAPPGFALTYLRLPPAAGGVATAYFAPAPGSAATGFPEIALDPATGHVQGLRDSDALRIDRLHFANFIYSLHYSLHAGETVTLLLGILSALWLIDHVPATMMALPSRRRWRESFQVPPGSRGHRRNSRLHRALGLWLLPVTAMLAFSGVYFNWRPAYDLVVGGLVGPRSAAVAASAAAAPPRLGFEAAAAIAARAGAGRIDGISLGDGRYDVRAHDRRDLDSNGGRLLGIDGATGRVLEDRHRTEGRAADIVDAWQYPLHSGKALGWPGRLIILMAGLATCTFVITGFAIWARKRSARTATRQRSRPGPSGLQAAE